MGADEMGQIDTAALVDELEWMLKQTQVCAEERERQETAEVERDKIKAQERRARELEIKVFSGNSLDFVTVLQGPMYVRRTNDGGTDSFVVSRKSTCRPGEMMAYWSNGMFRMHPWNTDRMREDFPVEVVVEKGSVAASDAIKAKHARIAGALEGEKGGPEAKEPENVRSAMMDRKYPRLSKLGYELDENGRPVPPKPDGGTPSPPAPVFGSGLDTKGTAAALFQGFGGFRQPLAAGVASVAPPVRADGGGVVRMRVNDDVVVHWPKGQPIKRK